MEHNVDVLLPRLGFYRDTLKVQVTRMRQEYALATQRWNAFSAVYEGVAADEFRAGWNNTCKKFDEYIEQTDRILIVLDEAIKNLELLAEV